MTRPWQISRRTMLRGLGATVTLPLLDVMKPVMAGASAATAPPRRMAFLFVPNGVNMAHWTPQRIGYGYDLPSILSPIEHVRNDVCVLSGLTHDKGRSNGDGPGDHARSASVFLTGCQPRKSAAGNIYVGPSVDQIAARQVGQATRFPSLELGCDRSRDTGSCDSGYACSYSYNISWSSPTSPVAKEIEPRLVFERLFGQRSNSAGRRATAERQHRRKSVLDFVRRDAARLQDKVSRADRQKLQEYLDSVRQIERRVERSDQFDSTVDVGAVEMPEGIPEDYAEHVRLMMDMIALAFQTDQTRISTCMLAHAGSNRSYGEIGVPDGHHELSHHGRDPAKLEKIRKINLYHVQQFAYLLDRLKSISEGEGTLLDQCMIVYGSGLSDGNWHNNENLPVLLAGRGGGTIQSGRHVAYPEETPMTNLFLSMLDRMDAPVPVLGDSTGRLQGLSQPGYANGQG